MSALNQQRPCEQVLTAEHPELSSLRQRSQEGVGYAGPKTGRHITSELERDDKDDDEEEEEENIGDSSLCIVEDDGESEGYADDFNV